MVKIIFFQAHPDDLEHKCGHLMHYLATKSKKNNNIRIASMTRGEFGLPGPQYDKFKGNFLGKISPDNKVGIVTFSSAAYTQSELTKRMQ